MSNCNVLADRLNKKNLECSELKEKFRKWELLAISSIQDLMDAGWKETKLLVKNEMLSSNVELVEKDLKDVSNQAEKVEVWAEKLECDKKILQNDVRILMEELALTKWKVEKAEKELKVAKAQAEANWRDAGIWEERLSSALVDIGTLEFDKKRLQNENGGLRAAGLVEKPKTEKDLELVSALQELTTIIVDLRVRLSNCGHWSTYGVIPNVWDAMALIRKEASNV